MRRIHLRGLPRGQTGFSLIEVLIALLVLAVGLLGLAFLQVLNVRYTNSAQHRTVATNLASEVLDMMRSTPRHLVVYNRLDAAYAGARAPGACTALGEQEGAPLTNIARWQCNVASSLPAGRGTVVLAGDATNGYTATVTVTWVDDVGRAGGTADGVADGLPEQSTSFVVVSQL